MKIQLSESVLSEAEAEVGTERWRKIKRASCCYVLLGRPEGENHCVSYSEAALRHVFSFGESREAPLVLSRMNFSIGPVYKKDGTPRNTLSQCLFRELGHLAIFVEKRAGFHSLCYIMAVVSTPKVLS